MAERSTVEGAVQSLIFQNEDNGYTVLSLLTDDGELAHTLLSPKKHVDKVYYARVSGRLTPEDCAAFEAGMTLGDGLEAIGIEAESSGYLYDSAKNTARYQIQCRLIYHKSGK